MNENTVDASDLMASFDYSFTWLYCSTHTHPFNGPLARTTWVSRYHLVFYRPDALPAAQPTASKHVLFTCFAANQAIMDPKIVADLRPSADGSAVHTSLVTGGG